MRPVEQTGGITGPELYVKSAAALMGVSLDPAWVAGIARNIEILLTAARATEIPGAEQLDVGPRFEP